jgi:hypothetical protein
VGAVGWMLVGLFVGWFDCVERRMVSGEVDGWVRSTKEEEGKAQGEIEGRRVWENAAVVTTAEGAPHRDLQTKGTILARHKTACLPARHHIDSPSEYSKD